MQVGLRAWPPMHIFQTLCSDSGQSLGAGDEPPVTPIFYGAQSGTKLRAKRGLTVETQGSGLMMRLRLATGNE